MCMAQLPAAVVVETRRAPVGDFGKFTLWRAQFAAEVYVSFSVINSKVVTVISVSMFSYIFSLVCYVLVLLLHLF